MKKTYNLQLLITVLLLISSTLSAQDLYIGAGGGFGTFRMDKLRDFNESLMEYLPVETKLTDDFPPYFLYKAEILYSFPKILSVGFTTSATSTGSRMCRSDYSGSYSFDNIQRSFIEGIKVMVGTFPEKKSGFCLSMEGGVAVSFLTLSENITVFNDSGNNIGKFSSVGLYLQPGIDYFWQIVPNIMVGCNLSYFYGFHSTYHRLDDIDSELYNASKKETVGPQWDGLRLSVAIYYRVLDL